MEMEAVAVEGCAASKSGAAGAAGESWNGARGDGYEDGPAMGQPFEAFLNPMELGLARKLVSGLEPGDIQEEIHAWHLAASHLLAAQRIGKSRQDGLGLRAEQIEVGLAVRLMALADRKSASLDRHRAFRQKAADEADRRAVARAYQEAEAAKRAAEDAKQAERAARRRRCREEREQEEQEKEEKKQDAQEQQVQLEAAGDDAARSAPALSEAEAVAQLAWEQAIEASRVAPEDRAEVPEPAGGSPAPDSERDP